VFFQGRGNVYLQEINADETLGPAIKLCTDSLAIALATESWTHINKCAAVDVEDARGIKSQSATVTLALADMADRKLALGIFGTVNTAGSPGTVTAEFGPENCVAGDYYFLGGKTRHRAITSLVVTDDSTSPATSLSLNTNYTLDAASGLVTFVTAVTAPKFAYGYTDPAYVSIFTAAQKEYMLSYEFINKQESNDAGSLELYKVRFDPAANLDFQSEENQSMALTGSALADTERDADTELGQFGRRVL